MIIDGRGEHPLVIGEVRDLSDSSVEVALSFVGKRSRCFVSSYSATYGRAKFILGVDNLETLIKLLNNSLIRMEKFDKEGTEGE